MKSLFEGVGTSSSNSPKFDPNKSSFSSTRTSSLLSGIFVSSFSFFKSENSGSGDGWTASLKRFMESGSMWRIKEHMMGCYKSSVITSNSDIWLLGVCYKLDSSDGDPVSSNGFAAFVEDFSSRILITYRKGFDPIGDSKYTSDVNWGCMVRSSQMLVAQALVVHQFGRSWRILLNEKIDQGYIEILRDFDDSAESAFSIHKLLEAGKGYGLAAGSWVGPYAMCRAWENLARGGKEEGNRSLPMVVYIVGGDEDGERGGAPVVCVEDVLSHFVEYSGGQSDSKAVLLLVPLVLGLDKLNPRYVPLLGATFAFPQSLGILGGRPGASTYIVGVQDDKAFYLDPHEVHPAINIKKDDLEPDTSSYHCNVVRQIPLESIDPSLAIGFYCRNKDEFDDFCYRASKLAEESNGAPMFTITRSHNSPKTANQSDVISGSVDEVRDDDYYDMLHLSNVGGAQEDDWQVL